jgi:hypothetical protein
MMKLLILAVALLVVAGLLVHYKPKSKIEGFTVAAANPVVSPACTQRSPAAQRILAACSAIEDDDTDAGELRVLLAKICCMEADISSPAAGTIRTLPLAFYTSHDMDTASTVVGSCRAASLKNRDIELILNKFSTRGHELVSRLLGPDSATHADMDEVLKPLRWAMTSFCMAAAPNMERPAGPRDPGFWESDETSELIQYQGISASPK